MNVQESFFSHGVFSPHDDYGKKSSTLGGGIPRSTLRKSVQKRQEEGIVFASPLTNTSNGITIPRFGEQVGPCYLIDLAVQQGNELGHSSGGHFPF